MNRRESITGLLALAAAAPRMARAQKAGDRPKRVGVLMGYAEDDGEAQKRLSAFRKGIADLGWH